MAPVRNADALGHTVPSLLDSGLALRKLAPHQGPLTRTGATRARRTKNWKSINEHP